MTPGPTLCGPCGGGWPLLASWTATFCGKWLGFALAWRFVTFSIRRATPHWLRRGGDPAGIAQRAEGTWHMMGTGRTLGRAWRVGAVVFGLTLCMAGSAIADVPDGNVVNACRNNTTFAIRVIDKSGGQTCTGSETALSWQSLKWRGAWSASTQYNQWDVVSRNGSSYIAIVNPRVIGSDPATSFLKWNLLADGRRGGPPVPPARPTVRTEQRRNRRCREPTERTERTARRVRPARTEPTAGTNGATGTDRNQRRQRPRRGATGHQRNQRR